MTFYVKRPGQREGGPVGEPGEYDHGTPDAHPDEWALYLPHQCDAWDIASGDLETTLAPTVRRHPTWRIRAWLAWAWFTAPYRAWWDDRCRPSDERDTVCWRTAAYNGRCDRRVLRAVERGEEL